MVTPACQGLSGCYWVQLLLHGLQKDVHWGGETWCLPPPHSVPSPQATGFLPHCAGGAADLPPGARDVDRGLWVLEEETHGK